MPAQTPSRPVIADRGSIWSLRRITTDGSWIRELDGLRFVAIISVVLYHILGQLMVKSGHPVAVQPRYAWLVQAVGHGDRGVRLFFVISGFVLGLGFARQHLLHGRPVDLRRYFLRRVTRLEPPYILNLIICAVVASIYYHQRAAYMLPHLAASIFYLHNVAYRTPSAINGVTWSLEVEIQFYILAPLISLLFLIPRASVRRLTFLCLMAIAGAAQLEFGAATSLAALSILFYLQYFLAGLLLTDLYLLDYRRFPNRWQWDAVSLCGWPVVFLASAQGVWFHAVLPFLLLPLYIAAFKGMLFRRFFSDIWVATIGGMCYSIYLWHFFVIGVFFKLTRHAVVFKDFFLNYCAQVVLLGIPIAAVSLAAFVLIERPCMDPNWPERLNLRIRAAARQIGL
jgi:peptidoglycan/LPS O-acetylase OafA/YrhL